MAVVANVGSFTADGTPGGQDVPHGLGVPPKLLIMIHAAVSSDGFLDHGIVGIAFVDDDQDEFSISLSSVHNIDPAREDRSHSNTIRTVADGAGNRDEGTVTTWDATNFHVTWTTLNQGGLWYFLAIGGDSVVSNCLSIQVPASTGPEPYMGMGFQPQAVLFILAHATAVPQNNPHIIFQIGATDGINQWVSTVVAEDNNTTMDTARFQVTDACVLSHGDSNITFVRAAIDSLDPDGFTLDYSVVTSGVFITALGIAGLGGVKVGAFNKTTGAAPATNTVSGLPGNPLAILLASFQAAASITELNHAHIGLGISDGANEASITYSNQHAVGVSNVERSGSQTKAFQKTQAHNGASQADADVTLGSNQFDVIWNPNDAEATEILYIAFLEGESEIDIPVPASLPQDVQSIVEVVAY